jgi:uncharacterized protein
MIADDPLGGEPLAVAPVDLSNRALAQDKVPSTRVTANPDRDQHESNTSDGTRTALSGGRIITIIDGTSGKRQEIVIPETVESAGSNAQRLPENPRLGLAKADGRTRARLGARQ